jgi:AbrB family looped-hinge helix DNA binding protein
MPFSIIPATDAWYEPDLSDYRQKVGRIYTFLPCQSNLTGSIRLESVWKAGMKPMIKSTVTDKGQTTIPLPVREKLNLKSQQTLTWEVREDGSVIVKPLPDVTELFGILGGNGKNGHNQSESSHPAREDQP